MEPMRRQRQRLALTHICALHREGAVILILDKAIHRAVYNLNSERKRDPSDRQRISA